MGDNSSSQNSNSIYIVVIAVVAGVNAIVLSSDLNDGMRYVLTGAGVLALLACVYKLSSNIFRN